MCPNVHDDNMQCDRDPVRVVFWRGREEDDVVSAHASRTEPEDEMRRGGLNGGASEGTIGNILSFLHVRRIRTGLIGSHRVQETYKWMREGKGEGGTHMR